ncbi:Nramp family divalent metal transporter [Halobacteriaceae archaeon GCM10025711]
MTRETEPDDPVAETDGGAVADDVYTTEEVGEEYRSTVYRDLNYESLEEVPSTSEYPDTGRLGAFRKSEIPKVPKVSHIVGPSAIMLGASLGSGETMFWPTLIAENGWALYWAFWVGVITQFFINTELQRWTIATGESIFRAFDRISSFWPWFFLVAGFFHLGWPGWAAGASEVFAAWTGILPRGDWWIIGIAFMILIWLSYQAGPVLYNIIEKAQVGLMFLAILFALILVVIVGSAGELANVPAGAVSFGTLPENMDIAVFLGGLAYAGAGGYINLSQGVWAREKGYGMGTYQGRVKNPLRGAEPEEVHDGFAFEPTKKNLQRWRAWWKITQQEHFLTFVVGLLVVATVAMTISAEFARGQVPEGGAIDMWIDVIVPALGPLTGNLLYAVIFIALFSTQYAIVESFVRNSVDILYQGFGRQSGWDLSRVFLALLTIFTLWGIAIIGFQFNQPWILLVIGAAIAGAMMWPYNALTIINNTTRLPEHTQPGWGRVVAMWWATGFFGYFTILLIGGVLNSPDQYGLSFPAFQTTVDVVSSGVGGYVLWLVFLVVQVYTMYVSARAKLDAQGTVEGADEASGILA